MLKVIELFAGIGAQRQGLKEACINHEVLAISEIDKYALKVYEALHGETLNLGDIKYIERLPKADLWTYSFPCTDISISGRMDGFEKGSKTASSLLWEVQRLLKVASKENELPKYLLLENVKNLISKRFYPHFMEWCESLEELGYKNFYEVLNSKDYNIPQNRERVFMLSIRDEDADYTFPSKVPLTLKLKDLLEENVDEKYFISEKLLTYFCDMKNRNGYIRGLRFNPHDKDKSKYAWTITTNTGNRPTDNFVIEPPVVGAFRGRKDSENDAYKQKLEINEEGVSNTLTSVQKDNVVLVPQATKKGYAVAHVGDGIYTNRVQSKRGVVQKNAIPTLKTSPHDLAVVVDDPEEMISIRRLTPRECWRLMGWKDKDIDRAFSTGVSDTQLYKMAGNSIVVNCLTEIFKQLKQGGMKNV
jgi:DNA (cytosine-5)-methyltransferase 1